MRFFEEKMCIKQIHLGIFRIQIYFQTLQIFKFFKWPVLKLFVSSKFFSILKLELETF